MLTKDVDIVNGMVRQKTTDQIYKGFMIYKSGKNPAQFTAIKDNLEYQGSMYEVERQIDKYWEIEDAKIVLGKKKNAGDRKPKHPRWRIKGDRHSTRDSDNQFDIRNIEKETKANNNFRKVLFTADRMQLVIMCLKVGEEIGEEVHPTTDQFFRIEEGRGRAVINGEEILIQDGTTIIIKAGSVHNIINDSTVPLRLYSIYSPPHHQDGLVEENKTDETI